MGINLGVAAKVADADIVRTVRWLLHKPLVRRDMRAAGLTLMDGQGAARIAADLAAALSAAQASLRTAL